MLHEYHLNADATEARVLMELVEEANYADLVIMPNQINSLRVFEILAKSNEQTEGMKGKEIIAFVGSTGAGKSTSVNYFIGHSLETRDNEFGDKVVTLAEEQPNMMSAKIGQSLGTSETIYSQGLTILPDAHDN